MGLRLRLFAPVLWLWLLLLLLWLGWRGLLEGLGGGGGSLRLRGAPPCVCWGWRRPTRIPHLSYQREKQLILLLAIPQHTRLPHPFPIILPKISSKRKRKNNATTTLAHQAGVPAEGVASDILGI